MSVRFLANYQLERRLYYKSCTSSSSSIKALPNISNKYFGGNGISLPIELLFVFFAHICQKNCTTLFHL